jgi:hypothetical protein
MEGIVQAQREQAAEKASAAVGGGLFGCCKGGGSDTPGGAPVKPELAA